MEVFSGRPSPSAKGSYRGVKDPTQCVYFRDFIYIIWELPHWMSSSLSGWLSVSPHIVCACSHRALHSYEVWRDEPLGPMRRGKLNTNVPQPRGGAWWQIFYVRSTRSSRLMYSYQIWHDSPPYERKFRGQRPLIHPPTGAGRQQSQIPTAKRGLITSERCVRLNLDCQRICSVDRNSRIAVLRRSYWRRHRGCRAGRIAR